MTRPIRLKHVARIAVSNVDKKSVEGEPPVRLCNYTDVYYNERVTDGLDFMDATATPDQVRDFRVSPGDVLITKDSETADDIAVPALVESVPDNLVCGYHLALIRPDPELIEPRFLFWSLAATTARKWFSTQATGVTRFGLRSQSIADARLRLPAIVDQREIADFLDTETTRIDALIERKQRMIELFDERVAATIEYLLADHVRRRVRTLASKIGSGKTPRGGAESYVSEGIVFIRSQNVRMGRLDLSDVAFIDGDVDEEMSGTRVRPGDVLLNITGASLGRCAIAPESLAAANVNQHVCIIRPLPEVSGTLLQFAIRSKRVQDQIREEQVGGNRDGLTFEQVADLVVPFPSTPEAQAPLGTQLLHVEAAHRRAVELLGLQLKLLREHRQALITAAVTGQLIVAKAAA